MKLLAFGASTSKNSINKQLATFAANLVDGAEVEVADLNDFALPLYSQDVEAESGIPEAAKAFFEKIGQCDALIISFAEHNGSYTAAYKNLFDWCSRINPKVFQGKSAVFLSTSPGKGGANSVLTAAVNSAPYFEANVLASVSVPSFHENFDLEACVVSNEAIRGEIESATSKLCVK